MDVGVRLQTIRKLKGLSQRELAKRAGVTNSTISMIEKNSVSPSISSLKKVLGGIPMSLVEFFSPDFEQDSDTQVVYKASELIDISDGAVSMKLVGKAHPSRAIAFLDENDHPSDAEIRHAIEGNLCRCTGYHNIVRAVEYAAAKMRGEEPPPPEWESGT